MTQEKNSKIWIARPYDPDLVQRLSNQTKISPLVAQILAGRDITSPNEIVSFLAPPNLNRGLRRPEKLPGCVQAAKFLAESIRAKKRVVVYGDYDVDGMTAVATLLQAIRICGGDCVYYVPNRLEEGYGLNCDALKLFKEREHADVVVTVDCGITSIKEIAFANSIGLETVVTDHHTPIVDEQTKRQILPDAAAIVHPKLELEGFPRYPFPEICGSFVAFKLAWQLGVEMGNNGGKTSPEMREFLLGALGLAALGTVADVMPLRDENRVLTRFALERSLVERPPLGLKFLLECSSQKKRKLTSDDVSLMIAPRLNAAGREVLNDKTPMDEEDELKWRRGKQLLEHPHPLAAAGQMGLASLGVELLITDKQARARELAPYVNELNQTRQKIERRIMSEALKMIEEKYADDPAFVLASPDWHPGVIGVVAGRISDRFYRPTILISLRDPESNPGSARGIPESSFNMYDALDACSQYLERFGGHAGAAGLGIKESNVDAFRNAFRDYVASHFSKTDCAPKLYIDAEAPLAALTPQTLHEIEKLAPFGAGNPHPVFAAYGVSLDSVRAAGARGVVLQAKFRQHQTTRRAVCFNRPDWIEELEKLRSENALVKFDVAFSLAYNDFVQQVEMRLLDWRVAR